MRHLAYELMILIKDVVSFTDGSISMMCKISLSIIQWSVRVTKRGYLRITSASLAAAPLCHVLLVTEVTMTDRHKQALTSVGVTITTSD